MTRTELVALREILLELRVRRNVAALTNVLFGLFLFFDKFAMVCGACPHALSIYCRGRVSYAV